MQHILTLIKAPKMQFNICILSCLLYTELYSNIIYHHLYIKPLKRNWYKWYKNEYALSVKYILNFQNYKKWNLRYLINNTYLIYVDIFWNYTQMFMNGELIWVCFTSSSYIKLNKISIPFLKIRKIRILEINLEDQEKIHITS